MMYYKTISVSEAIQTTSLEVLVFEKQAHESREEMVRVSLIRAHCL